MIKNEKGGLYMYRKRKKKNKYHKVGKIRVIKLIFF